MLEAVATTIVGLVLGILTGFYFERRSLKAVRAENEAMVAQLARLRSSLLSAHGAPSGSETTSNGQDLRQMILDRARETQAPDGSVDTSSLMAYLTARGYAYQDVSSATAALIESGLARPSATGIVLA